MNWEAVGAIAELVGAVGVVLTLIFLIIQIRQNTRAIRAASYQASVAPISALAVDLGMNAETTEILFRGGRSPELLSEIEWVRFSSICVALMRNFDNIHYQYRAGTIDENVWSSWNRAILAQFFLPGMQKWYAANKSRMSPEFQEFLARADRADVGFVQGFSDTPKREPASPA